MACLSVLMLEGSGMFLFAPVYLGSSYMSISINKKAQSMGSY